MNLQMILDFVFRREQIGVVYTKTSRDEYYEMSLFPNYLNKFLIPYRKTGYESTQQTLNINNIFLGDSEAQLVKELGEPRYVFEKNHSDNFSTKTYFYKMRLFGKNVLIQYAFVKDTLICSSVEFKSATSTSFHDEVKDHFSKTLLEREYAYEGEFDLLIKDKQENLFWLNDNAVLRLNYFISREKFLELTGHEPFFASELGK